MATAHHIITKYSNIYNKSKVILENEIYYIRKDIKGSGTEKAFNKVAVDARNKVSGHRTKDLKRLRDKERYTNKRITELRSKGSNTNNMEHKIIGINLEISDIMQERAKIAERQARLLRSRVRRSFV